jgi:Holliday junction DNA helicase RuvA
MIWALRGSIIRKNTNSIAIDTGNVIYEVFFSLKEIENLKEGQDILVYIRENAKEAEPIELIGFLSEESRYLYDMLISVNGIGSKNALKIMDFVNLETLSTSVESKDVKFLSSLPGIGQKTAERIILELSGKIKEIGRSDLKLGEAVETLIALGFPRNEAFIAVKRAIDLGARELEDIVKTALSTVRKV